MASPVKPEKVKTIFLGNAGVGKTSIIQYFMYNQFSHDYESTVGIDFFNKVIPVNGRQVNLQIWDTAGQEQFKSLIPGYIREAQIVILVYDLSDPKTLDDCKEWYKQVIDTQGSIPTFFLVGNKSDLGKTVSNQAIEAIANGHMTAMETSAKTGDGIAALFKVVADSVQTEVQPQEPQAVAIEATPVQPQQQKSGCC